MMNIHTEPKPYCPECGAKMVLREPRGRQQWDPFWGCPEWPDCDGKRQVMEDGTPEPDDEFWADERW